MSRRKSGFSENEVTDKACGKDYDARIGMIGVKHAKPLFVLILISSVADAEAIHKRIGSRKLEFQLQKFLKLSANCRILDEQPARGICESRANRYPKILHDLGASFEGESPEKFCLLKVNETKRFV